MSFNNYIQIDLQEYLDDPTLLTTKPGTNFHEIIAKAIEDNDAVEFNLQHSEFPKKFIEQLFGNFIVESGLVAVFAINFINMTKEMKALIQNVAQPQIIKLKQSLPKD